MKEYINYIFKIAVIIFIFTFTFKEFLYPIGTALYYSNDFMKYTAECDTAMEADWYYSQSENFDKKSNEIQLINCHEYDKLRKVLLMSGLNENYLSWLGLKSLELNQRPVNEFTRKHKFVER